MTETALPTTAEERKAAEAREQAQAEKAEPKQLDALHTPNGDTTIADSVVEKIAGIAAREVAGVYAMGSAAGRAISGLTQRIPGQKPSVSSGVSVKKGELQTSIEVSIVIEYGSSIVEVADNIRDNVIQAVEYATGLEVVDVDVNVTDVHLPDEDQSTDTGEDNDLK